MVAGPPTSYLVEIEWTPGSGVWDDVTADVDWTRLLDITVGQSGPGDGLQAGVLALALYNRTGEYTPENALSAHWPHVAKGRRIRVSMVRGGVTYWLYRGWIEEPVADDLEPGTALATFTATDLLGRLGQRTLRSDWEEQWAYRGATQTVDCWPMDDATSATDFRNSGNGTGRLRVVQAALGVGSWQQGAVDQGLNLPGQVTLTGGSGVGPVVAVDLGRQLGTNSVLTFAVKTPQECTATSGDYMLAVAYDAAGKPVWSLRLTWNGTTSATDVDLYNEQAPGYQQLILGGGGDEQWRACSVYDDTTQSVWFVNNGAGGAAFHAARSNGIRYLALGGRPETWQTIGKQRGVPDSVSIAGVAAASASTGDLMDYARPLVEVGVGTRLIELVQFYAGDSVTVVAWPVPGVTRTPTSGRTVLDCLSQVVETSGTVAYHDYATDTLRPVATDEYHPTTSTATITVEQDDDATVRLQWAAPSMAKPTRVTVSSPHGSATARDAVAEDEYGLRQEESWESCASSTTIAYALAGQRLNRSLTPRIPQLAVNLADASTDLYATVMAIRPGHRITIAGLPSAMLGVTSTDAYVLGWRDSWGVTTEGAPVCRRVMTLQVADRPSEARLDSVTYGRIPAGTDAAGVPLMKVTSGTAVGGTGNGTLVVTTSSGPTLTTDASAYPLDLDWSGERVTITSAPASSTSPQTVTTTTRGKAPTVARAHSAGEGIDVWLPATVAAI